jgi:hypothetical protein
MEPCVFNPEHSAGSSRGGTCMMAGMRTRRTTSGEEIFLIDSGASHHTVQTTKKFEKYAIQNTDNNIRVKTASGHRLAVSHVGLVPGMGEILVCPDISENLISTGQLLRHGNSVDMAAGNHPHAIITTNRQVQICIPLTLDDRFELPYSRIEDLIHTGITPIAYETTAQSETPEQTTDQEAGTHSDERIENGSESLPEGTQTVEVTTPASTYTKEQKERAKKVRNLHDQLHCSDNKLKLALSNGLILGTHLTAQDVDTYREIYGPCLACLAGKVTMPSYRHDSDTPPATAVGQIIHVDLLKFEKEIVGNYMQQLFSVDEFSANKRVTTMKAKNITQIQFAFCDLISYYAKFGHKIETIICDSESVLRAARVYLGH